MSEKRKQNLLIKQLIDLLPTGFSTLKKQIEYSKLEGFGDPYIIPEYRTINISYLVRAYIEVLKWEDDGDDFTITGFAVYSDTQGAYLPIELLVHDSLLAAVKIEGVGETLGGINIKDIQIGEITVKPFVFPEIGADLIFDRLPDDLKNLFDQSDEDLYLGVIRFEEKFYLTFYDMKDGNYLVFDETGQVYSLLRDARPELQKLPVTLEEILTQINSGQFDFAQHLKDRIA